MHKIRILYLKKAVGKTRSSLWNIDHSLSATSNKLEGTLWVTLGEYDAILSYSDQYNSLFSYISEHNSKLASQRELGVFSRAMYLLPYLTDEHFECLFWNDKTALYLGVIRLHLVSCLDSNGEKTKKAEEIFKMLTESKIKNCMYQTVELGDIVLVVHSDSLNEILRISEELNFIPEIAKTYTYCGINYERLKSNSSISAYGTIPFVSMSFAVRETSGITPALQTLNKAMGKCNKYAITGTDDCVMTWYNLSEAKIIGMFANWITRKKESDYKQYDLLNMHTTIGVLTGLNSWSIVSNSEKSPVALCKKISTNLEHFGRHKPDWYKYINRLLSSLEHMASTSEVDEFVFLFYPSVNAVLENLLGINANKNEDERVFRYIQSWNYLMENIMPAEGQLIHMPEIHPQIFDIPPTFLEYIQAFLGQCVFLLRDDTQKDNVEFLLTPRMCERIEAHELFNIFEYKIGVVLIDIPFAMFKNLKEMQIALCHEASHFVGEKFRMRDYRCQRFIEAASILIAKNVFGSFNRGVINTLINRSHEALDRALRIKQQSINRIRLADIFCVVGQWLYDLFKSEEEYISFLKEVFSNEDYINGQKIRPIVDYQHTTAMIKYRIVPLLKDLYHLFRECFADLSAIYLLNLKANDYYSSIENQLSILNEAETERLAIRLAVVLAASKRNLMNIKINEKYVQLFSYVQKYYNQCLLPPQKEPKDQVFPSASIINLYDYLCKCYAALQSIDASKIKSLLVDNKDNSFEDWRAFYTLIDHYRSDLLNNF